MSNTRLTKIFFFILITSPVFANGGYRISVHWDGLADSTIYLANYFGSTRYMQDTLTLDKNGKGIFEGDSALHEGLYFIYKKPNLFFDVLIGKDQDFSIYNTFPDFQKNIEVKEAIESERFISFQQKLIDISQKKTGLFNRLKKNQTNKDSSEVLKSQLEELDLNVETYLKNELNTSPGKMLSTFLKGTMPVKPPKINIDSNHPKKDSLLWIHNYHYRSEHYLDNFDFSDDRILYTPVFHQNMERFLEKLTIRHPDTLVRIVNKLLDRSMQNEKVLQYVSEYLLSKYIQSKYMGMDAVFLAIGEKIYASNLATWVDSTRLYNIKKEIYLTRSNIIGKIAPELKVFDPDSNAVSLHSISADFIILVFYEPHCGFCSKEIPALYNDVYLELIDHNVEVMAFCTVNKYKDWVDFIEEHQLEGWYHVFDPHRDSHFDIKYNVQKTPLIYILDKDKKIIAKRIDYQIAKKFIQPLIKN